MMEIIQYKIVSVDPSRVLVFVSDSSDRAEASPKRVQPKRKAPHVAAEDTGPVSEAADSASKAAGPVPKRPCIEEGSFEWVCKKIQEADSEELKNKVSDFCKKPNSKLPSECQCQDNEGYTKSLGERAKSGSRMEEIWQWLFDITYFAIFGRKRPDDPRHKVVIQNLLIKRLYKFDRTLLPLGHPCYSLNRALRKLFESNRPIDGTLFGVLQALRSDENDAFAWFRLYAMLPEADSMDVARRTVTKAACFQEFKEALLNPLAAKPAAPSAAAAAAPSAPGRLSRSLKSWMTFDKNTTEEELRTDLTQYQKESSILKIEIEGDSLTDDNLALLCNVIRQSPELGEICLEGPFGINGLKNLIETISTLFRLPSKSLKQITLKPQQVLPSGLETGLALNPIIWVESLTAVTVEIKVKQDPRLTPPGWYQDLQKTLGVYLPALHECAINVQLCA